ncbi:MAG: hypothetical protein AABX54_02455 [Nanoarchaeota archaeon]
MKKTYRRDNNLVTGLFGIVLFLLVISVFYIITFLSEIIIVNDLQAFIPLVVFTGFFIFLVAAMLLALALFRAFSGFR